MIRASVREPLASNSVSSACKSRSVTPPQFPECPAIHEWILPRRFLGSVLTRHRFFEEAIGSKDVASAEALQVANVARPDVKRSQLRLASAALQPDRVKVNF
jgi:hypothetical protein